MPIYEYLCMKCNQEFEYLVFGSDDTASCPECNTDKVKRQMSACSFKSGGNGGSSQSTGSSSSSCASCAGGSCATCH
jgi:putative FmdB family regulatory protein